MTTAPQTEKARLALGILAAHADAAMWAIAGDLRRLMRQPTLGCRCRRLEALAAADHAQRTGELPRKTTREGA